MSETLTARELQTLRNMGNEAEAAADEIDALRAEVERLRGALEKLARLGNGDRYGNSTGNQIAIAALTPAEVKHDD
jgi:hypothetical protein